MNDDFKDGWQAGYKTGAKHGKNKRPYLRENRGKDVSLERFAGYRAGYLSGYYIDTITVKWTGGFHRDKRARHD